MWFFLALAMFTLALIVHSMLARMQSSLSVVFRFLCIGGAVGVFHVGLSLTAFGFTEEAISAILLYAAVCELYVFLFTL